MDGVFTCPTDHKHGETGTCYVDHGCRCADCRRGRAEYEYWREHMLSAGRELLVDATGTRRRLRALGAIGWSARLIGERYGLSENWVSSVCANNRVQAATAEFAKRVYDDLSMVPPVPVGHHEKARVANAKSWARRNGWPPPLAWDDDTIDDPAASPQLDAVAELAEPERFAERCDEATVEAAVRGEKPSLAPLERREVVRRLYWRRWSDRAIAEHIGGSARQVLRIRGELGLEAFDQSEMETAA
jgi:hypothetical protein